MNFKIYIHLLLVNIISGSRSQHFLIETVDNNQAEHGSDYAEERKEEFTPKIHGNDDAEEKVEQNNDPQFTMEALSNWWDNLINSNDTNINACGIGNLPTKCECDDGKSHSPQEIYNGDVKNMMKVMHAFDECKTGGSQNCECPNGKKFIIPVFKDDLKKLFEAVNETQAAAVEPGTDYADDSEKEPRLGMSYEQMVKWWDNMLNSNDTNINICGKGNLPTKCDCDDGTSNSPHGIYNNDKKNMLKLVKSMADCKSGKTQKCKCANGKKVIMVNLNEDHRKWLADMDESQAAAVKPGADYAGEQDKEPFIPHFQFSYESMVKWWDNLINSNDKNINICGKGNLPTKCDCDDGTSNSPHGIYNNDKKNMLKLVKSMTECKSGRTQKCKCANGKKVIMFVLNEADRKLLSDMVETQAAAGGETGSDYADEVAGGGEPEGVTVSGPEVEEAPGPEETFNSMIKGLAAMVHSDDKKMNACGKGNLPTKCVCGDGLSIKPAGVFNKHGKNWQKVLEAFATCKTGTAVNCDCANGEKFIMPPLDENVRKLIEIGRKSWRPLRHAKLGPL